MLFSCGQCANVYNGRNIDVLLVADQIIAPCSAQEQRRVVPAAATCEEPSKTAAGRRGANGCTGRRHIGRKMEFLSLSTV
uniref:Uncharacterized protein n=1 Tax=Setaria viridis TaxID=4556 RepID=A0A4U6UKK3_SETVI|nr:hypothetical protein SEVIR_5G321433v2 [Setaria viridis]